MVQKLTLPDTAKGGWAIDVPAMRLAVEFLEIAAPVEVKLTGGIQRRGAARFVKGVHVITMSTYMDATEASATLWHELTHAAQREYLGDEAMNRQYTTEHRRVGYDWNRFEIEARQMSVDMADTPLTKGAR